MMDATNKPMRAESDQVNDHVVGSSSQPVTNGVS
jgi:hypothetical protein